MIVHSIMRFIGRRWYKSMQDNGAVVLDYSVLKLARNSMPKGTQ